MGRTAGPSVKDDDQYEALRRQGMSKEKAARIANSGSRSKTGKRGGNSPPYEDWTRDDLYQQAKRVGIEGRSTMSKQELISALRHH